MFRHAFARTPLLVGGSAVLGSLVAAVVSSIYVIEAKTIFIA
jgi:hypothetical protein